MFTDAVWDIRINEYQVTKNAFYYSIEFLHPYSIQMPRAKGLKESKWY